MAAIAALTATFSCQQDEEKISSIETLLINPTQLEIIKGDTYQLELTSLPESNKLSEAIWSSSDDNIATVESGKVTAINPGTATIYATCDGAEATCSVTVLDINIESLTLTPDNITLPKGKTQKLELEILPAEAAGVSVNWSSSDETVASVNNEGNVTALRAGKTTIEASVGGKAAHCEITVEELVLNYYKKDIEIIGDTLIIRASVISETPEAYTEITWSTSDESIATIATLGNKYYEGRLSTFSAGEVTITATAGELSAECLINVHEFPIPEGVGDFFYSDGTHSADLDPSKTPIGIVFWTGNPGESDPTLSSDHPECTHGLVVALDETTLPWYEGNTRRSFVEWVENNTDFVSPNEGTGPYKSQGYNNTEAYKVFNTASENSDWLLQPIIYIEDYTTTVPAPASTSGWFVPSINELSLLTSGLDIDEVLLMNLPYKSEINNICKFINTKIAQIDGATPISTDLVTFTIYWSSTEKDSEAALGRIMTRMRTGYGTNIGSDVSYASNLIRLILAF